MRVMRGGVAFLTFPSAIGLAGCSSPDSGLFGDTSESAVASFTTFLPGLLAVGAAFVLVLVVVGAVALVRARQRGPVVPRSPVRLYVPEPYPPAPPAEPVAPKPDSGPYAYPYGLVDRPRESPR